MRSPSFATRLIVTMAVLMLAYGAFVGLLGRYVAAQHEKESLQRLSHGLARHIIEHWPQIAQADIDAADRSARETLLSMLMVVNPGVQVYLLDADGRVDSYIGEPGMVRQPQVDLVPVRQFLDGATLPLFGSDPMNVNASRIFSVAMFAPRDGDTKPPGYLYIVLDGQARTLVAGQSSLQRVWQGAAVAAMLGLLLAVASGVIAFHRLTRPLHRIAHRMRSFSKDESDAAVFGEIVATQEGDEVQAIRRAFEDMTERLKAQAAREQQQSDAHREMMAGVAHDLRSPLTALHGQLEALAGRRSAPHASFDRILSAALAQSDKVRRLSQQLFELCALQSSGQALHRERFRLDELVADAVQKFELNDSTRPPVMLQGPPPGKLELDGDLQLIERALSNLIDNAMRHAPGAEPVRVSLSRNGVLALIV
ncbi:MAG: HAMP domain-containing sensor histidine kinase, partial [Methyloversatilis sp.]|nr:HAMP domain-containing sensor histidine kinase [Methyloversatilis sp.]